MKKLISLFAHAVVGWAICGASIGIGRQIFTMDTTLILHAVVAPLAFAGLSWHYFKAHPKSSPLGTASATLGIVVGLDALLVAPLFERSYAMFTSLLGTWLPFVLIFVSVYLTGRHIRKAFL
jgi:hypothetical protein